MMSLAVPTPSPLPPPPLPRLPCLSGPGLHALGGLLSIGFGVSENGRRRVVGDGDEHMSAMEVAATVAADLLVAEVGTDTFNAAHAAVEALGLPLPLPA